MLRKFSIAIIALIFSVKINAQVHKAATHLTKSNTESFRLLNYDDTISYALGLSIGKFYQQQGIKNLNTTALSKGVKTSMNKDSALLTDDQIGDILMEASRRYAKEQQEVAKQAAAKAKHEGEVFMAKNKTNPGVVSLPDGIQYLILKDASGKKPADSSNVKVNYIGTLLDGTEFDNSYKRGQPLDIDVSSVIKGWTEVLQLMPVGSKWRIWIPSDLAYGDRGAGNAIPPGATLQFDIEVLNINK
ncbi:MAG: FKBP-type peptidyl-prolyl cis-trans isomerase [Arachidicoccus sp.]|nr:FKBP-type peptidyl-prolyl cis-trans isomerase [Arachidicoccus sp.]